MGSSAKGVLLFPEDQIPDGMTIEDIAEEWTRYNGIILFKPKPGAPLPQQIAVNSTNVGAYELLNLQMRLLEEISGVHGAMQGKTAASGTPASLYAQQTQNASLNLIDLFESYKTFREDRDTKMMKTIQQFYDETRYLEIAGDKATEGQILASPDKVRILSGIPGSIERVFAGTVPNGTDFFGNAPRKRFISIFRPLVTEHKQIKTRDSTTKF